MKARGGEDERPFIFRPGELLLHRSPVAGIMETMTADTRTHPLRLVFAAVQPILFVWATIVVLGIFAYTVMADSPALGSTTWQDVASVMTGWWLTAFGGVLHFDGVSIALPPLLITILTFMAAHAFIRKLPIKDWFDAAVLALSSGAATALLGLLAPVGTIWWSAAIGAAFLSLLAVLSSKNRADWFGTGFFTSAAGRAVYDAFMLARRAMIAALILALVAVFAAMLSGWSEILKINGYYIIDLSSTIMMVLFQAAYLPVYVLWALAYIVGAGFSVGAGTAFSALGVSSAPLPAIPILGALPQPGGGSLWLIALTAIVFIILGIRQARAFPDLTEVLITGSIQVGIVAILGSLLAVASQGAAGPDRLEVMGAEAPRMALMCAVVIGLPLLLGMILGHRTAVQKYREWFGLAKTSAQGLVNSRRKSPASPVSSHSADSPSAASRESVPTADSDNVRTMEDSAAEIESGAPSEPTTITAVTAQTAPDPREEQ